MIIDNRFDDRTLANMKVALDRVCGTSLHGERHDVRKRVAQAIIRCARDGKTTLGSLTEVAESALARSS
jgi:multimeric flavodoxin WrbA